MKPLAKKGNSMPLDIQKEVEELRQLYKEDPRQESFNLLLLGEYGTGKTFLLRTARKPIHIDSFDPGGTKGLRDYITRGDIIVDTRFERDDPADPRAFAEWYPIFLDRIKSGYFSHFGTYCLDSSTSWNLSILGYYLKRKGGVTTLPNYKDHYHYQMLDIRTYVKKMLDLPCDTVLTGHLELKQEGEGGKMRYVYATTGKGTFIIPSLFDEIWVASTKETSKGVDYRLLTENDGLFSARSRLKADGLLDTYEEPDLKKILAKAGMPNQDKEPLKW
jgi:hypothetical protein